MNKTVTVNIGGLVFHIEEQAYDKLRKYLEAIRGYFTTSDGRDEIIQDIESRIAEIFTERIGTSRQVVTDADVEFMINAMGRPEQVAGEDSENTSSRSTYSNNTTEDRSYRKLYRDPDDKVIGGVCAGISHYVGIDPLWLRLGFAIAFFAYGAGFWLYILLVIILPKAKTTAEKLEMKGKPVNIESIKATIEEEVEDLKNRFESGKTNRMASGATSKVARFFEVIGEILLAALKVIAKIIGGIFMLFAIVLLFALFIAVLGMSGAIGNVDIPVYITKLFLEPWQLNLAIVALILTLGIPLMLLLYRIARSLFKITKESRTLNRISGALWGLGLILVIFLSVNIGRDFRAKDQERIVLPIVQPLSDTLHLESLQPNGMRTDDYYEDEIRFDNGFSVSANGDSIRISRVQLDIIAAENNNFSLAKIVRANGEDRRAANQNLQMITYDIEQENSTLKFSEFFQLDRNQRYRNQQIQLVLKVPVGKSVYLSDEMEDIIYDIQNVTNTYDGDMGGHTWTMTSRGLECLNCDLPENTSQKRNQVKVRINGEDIDVEAIDDSINWDNKDVRINIDERGVVIDAKEKNADAESKKK
jgi:phage shock protein PspC (stress-responsive transcriptional regulator)